jgi:hypothetical protein
MLFLGKEGILLDLARQRIILSTEIDGELKIQSVFGNPVRATDEICEIPALIPRDLWNILFIDFRDFTLFRKDI